MKVSSKLIFVLSTAMLLAGCDQSSGQDPKDECPACPECTQCETCKECKECEECEECKECEECEECPTCPETHEHTFKTTWTTDKNSHWKEATCEHTNITKDFGQHIDLDKNGICDVCDYVIETVPNKYTVVWENYDGKVLEIDYDVVEGTVPEYNGEDPEKIGEEDVFVFAGWSPEVTNITKNEVFVAQYEVLKTTYKVTWKDDVGNILKQDDVQVGHIPSFGEEDPVKEATDMYEYVFAGWDKEITRVFEDTTYVASFDLADWCVTKDELLAAISAPESLNVKVVVNDAYSGLELQKGTYEFNDELLIEHVSKYGTVYITPDGKTIYYDEEFDHYVNMGGFDLYELRKNMFFPFSPVDDAERDYYYDSLSRTYYTEDKLEGLSIKYIFRFQDKKLADMHIVAIQESPYLEVTYYDLSYIWGGCDNLEIPEEVYNEAKYRLPSDNAYETAFTLDQSLTLTHYNYQLGDTVIVSISKIPDSRYLLKVDYGAAAMYYDGFYSYSVNVEKDIYVRFENFDDPKAIYLEQIVPECLAQGDYVYNEDTCCYEYDDTEHNTTYIIQFEFGLPTLIKSVDDTNGELLSEITFSDFNSTTVIIPEHEWNN